MTARWSKLFIPTLREDPAEARNAAHRLLVRAAYMRRQDYLYLGRRALRKIAALFRQELEAAGAQEMLWSSPAGAWAIAAEIRSYRQLPQIWYRLGGGTLECWSFGEAEASCRGAVRRAAGRCGVDFIAGRSEFIALSGHGEPVLCGGEEAASLDAAVSLPRPPAAPDPEGDLAPELFHTPGQKTIADLSAFTGLPESSQMKSVVMVADGKPVLAMLRGDHQLSETKLREELSASELRPASAAEIRQWFGADAGSLGPVGVTHLPVLADEALRGRRNMICGANRNDYHLRHVTPGEDFFPLFADLRMAQEGETSLDGAPLVLARGIPLARFRPLRKQLTVSGESGGPSPVNVSAVRVFFEQLLIAAAEQRQDADGLALAPSIAPFDVLITPVANDEAQRGAARELCESLCAAGLDTLLDDRDERPGVKFKDGDLIGIPYRVTIGKKLAQGLVEIRDRRARTSEDVALAEAVRFLQGKLK